MYALSQFVTVSSLQGMLFTTSDAVKTPMDFVRLWLHEASRVYGDKLIETKDMEAFTKLKFEMAKQSFEVYMHANLSIVFHINLFISFHRNLMMLH